MLSSDSHTITTVGKGLTCSPVFFTVTSLPTVMKMNVHADAENPLWRAVLAGPWEASGVRRCYVAFSVVGKGLNSLNT